MPRVKQQTVNLLSETKRRLREAAVILKWSEAQLANECVSYVLGQAALPNARNHPEHFIRSLADGGWVESLARLNETEASSSPEIRTAADKIAEGLARNVGKPRKGAAPLTR
jgi:hypothetical protein